MNCLVITSADRLNNWCSVYEFCFIADSTFCLAMFSCDSGRLISLYLFWFLEPFILNGRINRGRPMSWRQMRLHFKGKRPRWRMHPLDVHPAVVTTFSLLFPLKPGHVWYGQSHKVVQSQQTVSALIAIYNQGLLDFTTPVRELLVGAIVNLEPNVFYRSTPNAPKSAEFGRESLERLFAYAHTLLLGEARGPKVRAELLTYIFDPSEDLDTLIKDNSGSYHPFAKLRRMISHYWQE